MKAYNQQQEAIPKHLILTGFCGYKEADINVVAAFVICFIFCSVSEIQAEQNKTEVKPYSCM